MKKPGWDWEKGDIWSDLQVFPGYADLRLPPREASVRAMNHQARGISVGMTLPPFMRENIEGTTVDVYVQPRASRNAIVGIHEGVLKVRLTAPPVDGEANKECLKFLAELFLIPKSQLKIIQGHRSRRKKILIQGIAPQSLEDALKRMSIL